QMGKKPDDVITKIWKDWQSFASYAFNKSHSVCYAYLAYITGYLKTHYPPEFMAANVSRNLNDITEITKLMEESKRMGINVLGPDVNESLIKFAVNKNGDVRFGMAAIKGVGAGAAMDIVEARKNKPFKDIYNFVERVNLQTVNKKNIEALAMAGGFDSFGIKRSQFFETGSSNGQSFTERLIKYGHQMQEIRDTQQQSLFGGAIDAQIIKTPDLPEVPEWPKIILLEKEKELIGIYLSAHPLDDYKFEIENFASRNFSVRDLNNDIRKLKGNEITLGGMVTESCEAVGKTGKPYCNMTFSDYTDSYKIFFFGKDYIEFSKYCKQNLFLLIRGKVQDSYRPGQFDFKIKSIELLEEVRKNYIKSVTVQLNLNIITPEWIEEMYGLCKKYKGDVLLKFVIWDTETKTKVHIFSRNTKISFTKEMEKYFENQDFLSYKIN
ncbi:MAG: DNA polymerase III subunit alpha, partial [Prolixibacteraceae bacterium]|nr:DNA polymerase III subunit alpha [Prolixibacteraceae bacterium]